MIWATLNSWSCFCQLYTASSSAAKNIINLISILAIWWCPCVESSLLFLEEGVCYVQWVLLAKFCYPLLYFILYSKAKLACYSSISWLLTIAFQSPVMKRIFFWYQWESIGDQNLLPHKMSLWYVACCSEGTKAWERSIDLSPNCLKEFG